MDECSHSNAISMAQAKSGSVKWHNRTYRMLRVDIVLMRHAVAMILMLFVTAMSTLQDVVTRPRCYARCKRGVDARRARG